MANKITIDRGTAYAISGTYSDSAGNPIDITGATIRFTCKNVEWDSNATDTDALIAKTGSIVSPTAGTYLVSLTPADTYIDAGNYFYDIKIDRHSDASDIKRLSKGALVIDGSPTNRTT